MKKVKRIILFRFHNNFDVCRNRLKIIKKFNPKIEVYGLFGGWEKDFKKAKKLPLKNVWMVPFDDPHWKWLNGDLCIRWWFKEFGRKIKFDMLHIFEWDMVLLESVEKHFKYVRSGVAITNKTPLPKIYNRWIWVAPKRGRSEWLRLKNYVKKKFQYRGKPVGGIFGGACLSRKFLEKYARIEVPSWCNDEVRVPLFAQAFKMPVHDTKLKNKYFNATNKAVSPEIIYREHKKGIKSFHPVRQIITLKNLSDS